ncbi:hypothetical protein ACIA8K_16710 [Catenuloplanes sp. NPDC051500]|uniref:hypothetical protein n=1 Tax=Catenuloplanes sp. NPDC051500 TaxID=3363959 RepID=UPI0037AE3CB7
MSAGHHVARLLALTLAGAALTACAPTPLASTGSVISIDPKVCVEADTGADYCFEQIVVQRKVPGVDVGDCVEFTHTPPKKPGGFFRLESMNRCGEGAEDQGAAEDGNDTGNQ